MTNMDEFTPEDLQLLAGIAGPALAEAKRIESWSQTQPLVNGMPDTASSSILQGMQKIQDMVRSKYSPPQQPMSNPYQYPIPQNIPQQQPYPEPEVWQHPHRLPPQNHNSDQLEFDFKEPSEMKRVADALEKISRQLTTLTDVLKSSNEQPKIDTPSKGHTDTIQ